MKAPSEFRGNSFEVFMSKTTALSSVRAIEDPCKMHTRRKSEKNIIYRDGEKIEYFIITTSHLKSFSRLLSFLIENVSSGNGIFNIKRVIKDKKISVPAGSDLALVQAHEFRRVL